MRTVITVLSVLYFAAASLQAQCSLTAGAATPAVCADMANGVIDLAFTAGSGPYSYAWAFDTVTSASTTFSMTGLPAGSYTITATDESDGCTATATMSIAELPLPILAVSVLPVTCIGSINGSIQLTVSGGTAPFSYAWSNGSNAQNQANLSAGVYMVTVTSADGCSATASATVGQPVAPLSVTLTTAPLQCNGGHDGAMMAHVTGGTVGYTYNWNHSEITAAVYNLGPGWYSVTVTDATGCTASASGSVNEPTALNVFTTPINAGCGQSDGAIYLSVGGGIPGYTFDWSDLPGSADPEDRQNLSAGAYAVTITDARGCTRTASVTVGSGTTAGILTPLPATPASACNSTDGQLQLVVAQVQSPYSYAWTNGATSGSANGLAGDTLTFSGLSAGAYAVTVTGAGGCTAVRTGLAVGSPMTAGAAVTVQPGSCATPDATVTVSLTGGAPAFEYAWEGVGNTGGGSSGSAPVVISGLWAGAYTISITDAAGCFAATTIDVPPPSSLNVQLTVTPNPCGSQPGGSIQPVVTGGIPGYSYAWSNGSTTAGLQSLADGDYCLTVVDNEGCTGVQCATMTSFGATMTLDAAVTFASCATGSGGAIELTVNNGNPPYTFDWADIPGTNNPEDRTNLTAGTYSIAVVDANGCSASSILVVPAGFAVQVVPTAVTSCLSPNGTITAKIGVGGIPPYAMSWNGVGGTSQAGSLSNQPGPELSTGGLTGGFYSVTVTNGDGCTRTSTVYVEIPGVVAFLSPTATSCIGVPTGSFTVNISQGQLPPYAVQWSASTGSSGSEGGITATAITFDSLPAGTYTVTVTDSGGCTDVSTTNITNGNMLVSGNTVSASCSGGTGQLTLNVNAPANLPPFTYSYTGPGGPGNGTAASMPHVLQLPPGAYTVTVTNAAGCSGTRSSTISAAYTSTISSTNPACSGGANGSIAVDILSASGGPYTYAWVSGTASGNGGSPTEPFTIAGLTAGSYTVTVTTGSGCTATFTRTLTAPAAPTLTPVLNITNAGCNGASNGAIQITSVSGPNPPFTYAWTGPNGFTSTQQSITGLAAGTYVLTITNAPGCPAAPVPVTIVQPAALVVDIAAPPCGSATATAPVSGGAAPYAYLWNDLSTTAAISVVAAGTYSVTVIDASGCTATDAAFLQPNAGDCGLLRGYARHDLAANCQSDAGDPGLAGWIVRAAGNPDFYATTAADGSYELPVTAGTYTVELLLPSNVWSACGAAGPFVVGSADTVTVGDLLAYAAVSCPVLDVQIGTPLLRRCFPSTYTVQYCNLGSATALDAFVDVALDPFLVLTGASLPYNLLPSNTVQVDLGDLPPGFCGAFTLAVLVSCNAVLGQTHCTEAHIYPDTLCLPPSPLWSGASMSVTGTCEGDSIAFTIRNVGAGPLAEMLDYIVIEDHVLRGSGQLNLLPPGDSMVVRAPANGSTWRMEVDQAAYHPVPGAPAVSIEGCTAGATFTTGFITQFPVADQGNFIDIDCQPNVGSYDPNDKQGFPVGYGPSHYVPPGTEVDYRIRFQNTGTDTAFTVVIVDTLAAWLDPATVRAGVGSHAYAYELYGPGIVKFTFENILLPDSNVNEPASHGFVKFTVKPKIDAPLETLVENTAEIYFDFNEPIVTNTTAHRLGENFLIVSVWNPGRPEFTITASPNPFADETRLAIRGLPAGPRMVTVRVYDLAGRLAGTFEAPSDEVLIRRGQLQAGTYIFWVEYAGKRIGHGRLAVH